MTDLEIVEDDLEKLSNAIGDVAATVAGVDLPTAMARVPAAIPGATSASLASSATTALDTRRDSLQERYQDFSADVMTAANTYRADDAALAGSAVLSSGAGVDQALATLKSLTGNHDAPVNEVSELMMATADAAVGVGDVDTAEHVSTYVPGMGTNPADTLDRYVEKADHIRNHATDQHNGTVATVAWLGYDAPPGAGQPGWTSVTSTSQAEAGADSLNSFTEGINASRAAAGGVESHQTILGHSYGSTTSGIAVSRARESVADDLVMFGSPGSGAHDIREYNLGTGQAHVSAVDSHDRVQGAGPDSSFGVNPTGLYGINHLSGDAPRPQGINNFNPIARHSNYLMEGAGALEDMAKVVAGKAP